MPLGRGRERHYNSFEEECKKRTGIITVNNINNLCLPIAVIISKAFADKNALFKIYNNKTLQLTMARELMQNCNWLFLKKVVKLPKLKKIKNI